MYDPMTIFSLTMWYKSLQSLLNPNAFIEVACLIKLNGNTFFEVIARTCSTLFRYKLPDKLLLFHPKSTRIDMAHRKAINAFFQENM